MQPLRKLKAAVSARPHRKHGRTRLATACWRLALVSLAAVALAEILPGTLGTLFRGLAAFCATACVLCLIFLIFRWMFRKILWTVRSRLIVTCLLLGFAPVVLLPVLGELAAYLLCGQFATRVALGAFDSALTRVQEDSAVVLSLASQAEIYSSTAGSSIEMPDLVENGEPVMITAWRDGKHLGLHDAHNVFHDQGSPFRSPAPPTWLKPGFEGLVETSSGFFLCAASGGSNGSHTLLTLACSTFGNREVAALAAGLGNLRIMPHLDVDAAASKLHNADKDYASGQDKGEPNPDAVTPNFARLEGGVVPPPTNSFDVRVYFSAPMHMKEWATGADAPAWLFVTSRPVLLYRHLFAASLRAATIVRMILVVTSIVFAVLELLALLMAAALIRTITQSVGDLYEATQEVDKGDLDHRIPVRRHDQLAALAGSFNKMIASLKTLLAEQREKDRMQNELNIAREVQENLFPHATVEMPGLELYGVCQAARTIGGDYYDFIPNGDSQLYLALGDISGKGISAALLMASLHSAVRAYCENGFPELQGSLPSPGLLATLSPGRMLALLNRHLFASTQPEKYATMFLAHYDSSTRLLTYSNGGHLPPLLLCANGDLQRLDCGGTVIGLFNDREYPEATIQMSHGDLLVLFSDGVTEPERDTAEFGEQRLIDVIRVHQRKPLREIAAHAFAAVHDWIGDAEQPDDMTVVLARLV